MSKEIIALITALVVLSTAVLGLLNKTGVVEVPVISQVPIFQNDGDGRGGGGGGGVVTVAVPDVRGMTVDEASAALTEAGFRVERVDSIAIELCDRTGFGGELPTPGRGAMAQGRGGNLDPMRVKEGLAPAPRARAGPLCRGYYLRRGCLDQWTG